MQHYLSLISPELMYTISITDHSNSLIQGAEAV